MKTPLATAKNPASKQPADLEQSVAGEEDPGAAIDIDERASATSARAPLSPGDEARPGTPGTGEDICPDCGGSGKRAGRDCPTCQGTGKVTVAIGGA
jgi:hypothetical protein